MATKKITVKIIIKQFFGNLRITKKRYEKISTPTREKEDYCQNKENDRISTLQKRKYTEQQKSIERRLGQLESMV